MKNTSAFMDLKSYLSAVESAASLAERVGVTPGFVSQWLTGVRRIPVERCIQIEEVTGGKVLCEHLRPDINWSVLRNTKAPVASEIHHEVSPSGT